MVPSRKDQNDDDQILPIQLWIENNFDQNFDYDLLARRIGMYRHTMYRRLKNVTSKTTLTYQQGIRVEVHKRLLESETRSFDEVTYQVRYEDGSTFRKIFSKQTGLVPTEYRKKFQPLAAV